MLLIPYLGIAASPTMPPPKELASLAEQLAPLIKSNQTFPALKKTRTHKTENLSPVEEAFSQRAGSRLTLFGYSQIGRHISEAPTTGQVQDDIILGAGDRIMVTFRGQRDDSKTYGITPQGELIVDGLDPITAAGMTVSALRHALENAAAKNLMNSTVFLSVKSLRQISITVMGEVKRPGVYTLSPFQTVLDALAMTHGITKNGSLRNVKLLRAGKTIPLDFYQLLTQGDLGVPIQLRDGDKLMVPVLGQTIAVAGDVKRPGIFELPPQSNSSIFSDVLHLSGGVVRPGANQFVKLSLTAWGDEKVSDLTANDPVKFTDGDMVMVTSGTPMRTNGIQLVGHVRQPGPRSVTQTPDLKTLLNNPRVLREGIYPLIGIIERMDMTTFSTRLIEFSPVAIMQGADNKKLLEHDRIVFFSSAELRRLLNRQSDTEHKKAKKEQDKIFIRSIKVDIHPPSQKKVKQNPIYTKQIIDFLMDRIVTLNGALLKPGYYPLAESVTLKDLIAVAGGLTPDAEKAHIDLLHNNMNRQVLNFNQAATKHILITAKDKLVIPSKYTVAEKNGIEIIGEVLRPGKYDLRKGDTLMDIIERAGGITSLAFPAGTIFMRESERYKQEEQFRNAARSLDLAIAGYYLKKDSATEHAAEIKNAQKVADELRRVKALGRITVQADPDYLKDHPQSAMLLQPGDRIYIPRRSPSLAVAGEVMSPVVLQYDPNLSGNDYIRKAGGTTKFADTGRNFVVFPDGSAMPLSSSWFGSTTIPAGSTIIVPRDPDPLDFLKLTESIGNIMSQLAITAVATAQLQRPYY
jgi:polysaccharide biosynthesis/export protein